MLNSLREQNEDWKTVKIRTVLKETEHKIVNNVYKDYEELRGLSRLIIRKFGVNVFSTGKNNVSGLLIDMTKLWEDFLYEAIFKKLHAKSQEKFKILKSSQDSHYRTIRPDFYIEEEKLVIDAKYEAVWGKTLFKQNWKDDFEDYERKKVRNDVFQVFAYMLSLKCSKGGVIFPVSSENCTEKQQKEFINEKLSVYGEPVASNKAKQQEKADNESDKYFFRIPFRIPADENYKKFDEAMEKQIAKISYEGFNKNHKI